MTRNPSNKQISQGVLQEKKQKNSSPGRRNKSLRAHESGRKSLEKDISGTYSSHEAEAALL